MLTDYQIIANCAKLGYLGQLEAEHTYHWPPVFLYYTMITEVDI